MFWAVIISTAIIALKQFEAVAYGHYPYRGTEDGSPFFSNSPVSNPARPEFRPSRSSDVEFNDNFSWNPDFFYPKRPEIHGPQVDINANNFLPQGQTPPFGESGDPSSQNSAGRIRKLLQLENNVNNRPNLFLPPAADDPDDIFIFDRPTSPRPTLRPTPRPTPRPTLRPTPRPTPGGNGTPFTTNSPATANCDCPSTPEFNPVCGSDGVTYTNPGKLKCAIFCGTAINMKHYGTCISTSTSNPTPSTSTTTANTSQ